MEVTGNVIAKMPVVSGTSKAGNSWQKQEFVVETSGQYPRKVCFQLFGDKVDECPAVGDEVKVNFDPESREWQGRWFTQLNAWKVEKKAAAQQEPAPAAPQHQDADNLPF